MLYFPGETVRIGSQHGIFSDQNWDRTVSCPLSPVGSYMPIESLTRWNTCRWDEGVSRRTLWSAVPSPKWGSRASSCRVGSKSIDTLSRWLPPRRASPGRLGRPRPSTPATGRLWIRSRSPRYFYMDECEPFHSDKNRIMKQYLSCFLCQSSCQAIFVLFAFTQLCGHVTLMFR